MYEISTNLHKAKTFSSMIVSTTKPIRVTSFGYFVIMSPSMDPLFLKTFVKMVNHTYDVLQMG
jgi:hypothetical protein